MGECKFCGASGDNCTDLEACRLRAKLRFQSQARMHTDAIDGWRTRLAVIEKAALKHQENAKWLQARRAEAEKCQEPGCTANAAVRECGKHFDEWVEDLKDALIWIRNRAKDKSSYGPAHVVKEVLEKAEAALKDCDTHDLKAHKPEKESPERGGTSMVDALKKALDALGEDRTPTDRRDAERTIHEALKPDTHNPKDHAGVFCPICDTGRPEMVEPEKKCCGNCDAPGPLSWCSECKKDLCGGCDTTDPHQEAPYDSQSEME